MRERGWVKLHDQYYIDPKVEALPADAEVLFTRSLAYAGNNETEGFIPAVAIPRLCRRRRYEACVQALVDASLWVPVCGDPYAPETKRDHQVEGYQIARWQDWQEEHDVLTRRRKADRERKRRERFKRNGAEPDD